MRFGLKVNPGTWDEATRWAGIAEDAGFDGLWTGDNMRNPRDPAIPVHDGPTLIAAWAATTSRIRVGLLIANVVLRRPTLLAKQAVTLDHISAGRFDLGIGSGVWPTDHGMSGVPMWTARERADRLAEFVAIVDRLLSGNVDDYEGAYYAYRDAAMTPAPVQSRIPLIVAAKTKALAVAAGHADAWVTFPARRPRRTSTRRRSRESACSIDSAATAARYAGSCSRMAPSPRGHHGTRSSGSSTATGGSASTRSSATRQNPRSEPSSTASSPIWTRGASGRCRWQGAAHPATNSRRERTSERRDRLHGRAERRTPTPSRDLTPRRRRPLRRWFKFITLRSQVEATPNVAMASRASTPRSSAAWAAVRSGVRAAGSSRSSVALTPRPVRLSLRQARPAVPARGNIRGNIQIVRYVHIVRAPGRSGRSGAHTDGYDTRVTRLRAWSGITGWRFESSSAHRKALHSGAFRVLSGHFAGERVGPWQRSWQHPSGDPGEARRLPQFMYLGQPGSRRATRRRVLVCSRKEESRPALLLVVRSERLQA